MDLGTAQVWLQVYDPLGHWAVSALLASAPVVVMLGGLGVFRLAAHWAALLGLASALLVAVVVFGMPVQKAGATAVLGAAYGLLPIGWIILNVIFLYQLTERRGYFEILRQGLTGLTRDVRLQLLLIAFCFGAFFEGAAGFGTPVAVTAAVLIGLGFKPLQASGLSLIANTAPVAYGALGTPIIALQGVTGLDLHALSAMVGRQLPFFSLIVPFWLVAAFAGLRGTLEVWPAVLVAGLFFAVPQFLVSNFHGPWLVDIIAAVTSMGAVTLLLVVWHPRRIWRADSSDRVASETRDANDDPPGVPPLTSHVAHPAASPTHVTGNGPRSPARSEHLRAWLPWILLSIFVFVWGLPRVKAALDGVSVLHWSVPSLDRQIVRVQPVVPEPTPEKAVYTLNWLSATGSGILAAALVAGLLMHYSLREMLSVYGATLRRVRLSLLTVAAMLSLGYVTRYAGLDATMGLAFARTGRLYPLFGTLLGWLGVALTGSDTASNVLFGSLQKITALQLGLSPILMAAANSAGGVMGKMIDAQSIVVASTATQWYGQEGRILRYVFLHSLALAILVGLLVMLQAYVPALSWMVPG